MDLLNKTFVRKVVQACLLGDAGFQCTLNGISAYIICTRPPAGVEKSLCVPSSVLGELLQVASIQGESPIPRISRKREFSVQFAFLSTASSMRRAVEQPCQRR